MRVTSKSLVLILLASALTAKAQITIHVIDVGQAELDSANSREKRQC